MKNILWYWDKKTHTTHAINNFYEGLTFGQTDFIEMHKTKGNAIWFPYLIQNLVTADRTGELKYISDIDYTEIDNETGKEILLPSYFVEVFKDTENPMIKYITCFIKSEKVDLPVEVIYRWYTLSEDGKRQYIDQNVIEHSNIIKINDRFFVSTR